MKNNFKQFCKRYDYMVYIGYTKHQQNIAICQGVIISKQAILTTVSCIQKKDLKL